MTYLTAVSVIDTDDKQPAMTDTAAEAVTELEYRYVQGERSNEEFEHRLEDSLKTKDTAEQLDGNSPLTDRCRLKCETETN